MITTHHVAYGIDADFVKATRLHLAAYVLSTGAVGIGEVSHGQLTHLRKARIAVLRQLADDGITIVIIEHTMHLMVRFVDSFVVLDHGKVLTQGPPEAIIRDKSVIEAYLGKKWSNG